jgi:hypothetical protein
MKERKQDRRSGASHFTSPQSDQRRPQFERRGTTPAAPQPTPDVLKYGERRVLPDAGLE